VKKKKTYKQLNHDFIYKPRKIVEIMDSKKRRGKETIKGKTTKKGSIVVDVLDEDKPLANQRFVCVSFISPEKIVKQKDHFFFEQFLKKYDHEKSVSKFIDFLNFVSYKYKCSFESLCDDLKDFVKEEKHVMEQVSCLEGDYKTFLDQNETELENSFNKDHDFQTSVRGLKIRGVYPTQEEAELRCTLLREVDPNHDVYVGPVGLWMPWEPEAYKTGRVEYLEDELNQLMHEKNKNESFAKSAFDARVKETKRQAIADNIEKAKRTGSTLTQNVDGEGNLFSIANTNTQEMTLASQRGGGGGVTIEDIRSELFEGDNIVLGASK